MPCKPVVAASNGRSPLGLRGLKSIDISDAELALAVAALLGCVD